MKKTLLITLGILLTTFLTAEGGVDFSGDVQTIWGAGAPWTDSDTSAGQLLLGTTSLSAKLDAYYDNSSALAEASLSYDAVSNKLDYSVDELWVDYTESFWGVRIGRQKTAWGKADGVDITNVVCPSDMSSFAAMTSDDSKLAIDAVRLSLTGNQFTADAFWIPFFTPAVLPLNEGNPLRKFMLPESVEVQMPGVPQPVKLPVMLAGIEEPEKKIWNGEYAAKLSGYFPLCDLSLYGFYGWDDTPFFESAATEQGILMTGKYKRMTMLGADAAIPIKDVVLRTEAAFFPDRYFAADEKRNELSALAGFDWMPSGWTITAQYFCDVVFGDLDPIEREDAYTHGATLSLSKNFLNETLEASFSGLMNFNDFDSMLKPAVNYSLSDQINLETGAYIFIPGPDEDGKYGAYKDLSSFYIKAKYSF